jgi:serine/threonine-protein kinase SRPK3
VKVYIVDSNLKEVEIISTLTRPYYSLVNNLGKTIVPSILDRLTIHGLNSNYIYYVIALVRASLSGVKDSS